MKDKIIKSKAVITADMLSKTDTTIDGLLSKDVCEEQTEEMAKDIRPILENRVDIGFIPDLDKPIAKTLVKQGYRKVNKDECEYWKSRCKEIGDVAYEKARKETAEKIFHKLFSYIGSQQQFCIVDEDHKTLIDCDKLFEFVGNLAKQFGVDLKGEE